MTDTELLAFVKTNLTNTGDAYDNELNGWIQSAETDIEQSTGEAFNLNDPIQCAMVVLYVRAFFGDGDETAEKRYAHMLKKLGIQKVQR